MTFKELKEEADYGYADLGGVYLNNFENMIAEQQDWADEDPCKRMDFSAAPYWLTTDDGQEPIAVCKEDDLLEAVPDLQLEPANLMERRDA